MQGELSSCCGCTSLRQGSLIIAGINIAIHVLQVIGLGVFLGLAATSHTDDALWPAAIAGLVLTLVTVAFDVVLVVGVSSDRPGLILAWLIWDGVILSLITVGQAVQFVAGLVVGAPAVIVTAAVQLCLTCLLWYWYAVVTAHRRALKNGAQRAVYVVRTIVGE